MTDSYSKSYYSEGLLEEAIAENQKKLEADPGNHMLRCSLANSLQRMGNLDEAIEEYRKCVETAPTSEYWNNLGKAASKHMVARIGFKLLLVFCYGFFEKSFAII